MAEESLWPCTQQPRWTATKRRVAASNRYENMSSAVMQERPQTLARATEGDANSFATLLEPLLDPAYRLAAVLLFCRALPLEEVARTLGVTTAAAKSRIYRAAKKLKSDLTLEEVF